MKIPAPKPEELLSVEKIKEYLQTSEKIDNRDHLLYDQVDQMGNKLGAATTARLYIVEETVIDGYTEDCIKLSTSSKAGGI